MHRLLLLGLNHKTAPLAVREKLAFDDAQRREAIAAFRSRFKSTEIVLISTCNRVELYLARGLGHAPRVEEIVEFLAETHHVPAAEFRGHLYHHGGESAARHLFEVASSLDSMVLGETQILGQVREAYDTARELGATGPMLNPLFQRAVAAGRQVMAETSLAEGRVSVASVAIDHARRVFDSLADKTVLSIGAGKMSSLVLQSLAEQRPGRVIVCNRDVSKAQALAARFGGQAVTTGRLADHLTAADIVVAATGSAHPLVTRTMMESVHARRGDRAMFLIDIALPRDIEPSVGELPDVHLYNLDDLQRTVSQSQAGRAEAIASAGRIIAEHVEQFSQDHRARAMGPVINSLYKRYHELAREELSRVLASVKVEASERSHLEDLTRRIVNKLLHDPVRLLRQGDGMHGPSERYLHAMEKLFRLNDDTNDASDSTNAAKPSRGRETPIDPHHG